MMKPGVVTAIRGSRKDVVEAIVGAILMQWMENGGLYRTSIAIHWHFLSLTAGCHQGASSKHHRRHVSAYAWRFAGTSTHKLQASVECEHGAVPVRPNLPGPGLHSALIPHSSSIVIHTSFALRPRLDSHSSFLIHTSLASYRTTATPPLTIECPWSPLTASRRRFSPQPNQQRMISPV